jgi:hypothetical protein
LVIFRLKLSVDFHQTFFKAIDPSLKIDVGGIIQGVLLDVQRKLKASFIVIIGSSIAITSGS